MKKIVVILFVFFSFSVLAQRQKPQDSPLYEEIVKMFDCKKFNPDSAMQMAHYLFRKADKDDNYVHLKTHYLLGDVFLGKKIYDSALYYYLEAIRFAKMQKFIRAEADQSNMLYLCGYMLKMTDFNLLAKQFYQESIKLTEMLGDTIGTMRNKSNLSIVYNEQSNHIEAIREIKEVINLSKRLNSESAKDRMIKSYHLLGTYYLKNKETNKGITILSNMFLDRDNINTWTKMHSAYYLSKAYSNQGKRNQAEEVLKQAVSMDPNASINGYFYCLYELGVLCKKQGRAEEAINYLTKAEGHAQNNPDNEREFFEVFQLLSDLYRPTNKALADTYHQKYLDALDKYTNNHRRYNLGKVVEDYYANIEQEERETKIRTYSIVISGSLLVLLGLTFSVSRYQRHRTKKKLEKESIDKRMAELKALKAQINPHFLFNALNSIQSYILSDEKNVAEGYLVKYGKLMRKILDHSNELTVPLQEELEALHLYVELEQLRVKQGFEYEVKLSDDLDPYLVQVPSMVIQPFIENAIWHGVSPLDHPGKITLSFEEEGDFIVVRVQDNGVGFDSEEENTNHTSKGVDLVRERLELLKASAGEESVLAIHSEPGKGTEVVLRFSGELV